MQEEAGPLVSARLRTMSHSSEAFDVAVVGGGAMGLSALDALSRRGFRSALVERFGLGHREGSSHGDGRIFRFTYPEPVYLEMARLAAAGWRSLEGRSGESLLHLTGNWDCASVGHPELEALAQNLARAGLPYQRLSAEASNALFPQLRLPAGSEALFQADGGVVLADRALAALARVCEEQGAAFYVEDPVVSLETDDAGVELRTASGRRLRAGRVVLAAGAWSRELLAGLGLVLPLRITREQVAYFAVRGGQDHRLGAMPTFIDYHGEKAFYGLPQIAVPGVKVGWHHAGVPIERPGGTGETDAANLEAVMGFVRERLPHLEPEPFETATCLYTTTPDKHFLLGRLPGSERVVVAGGFSGHGFKFAPAVGEIVCALALGEEPPLDLTLFWPERFAR